MALAPANGDVRHSIPADNDVVVVGSGLGGLTCALELARNGFKVCVLEQHRVSGGYAHSFRRRGYHFDISLHYIGGLSRGSMTCEVLSSLGVYDALRLVRRQTLFSAEFPEFSITLPNDYPELMAELTRLFPDERKGLEDLFALLCKLKIDVIGPSLNPDFDIPIEDRLSTQYAETTFEELLKEHVKDPMLLALLGQLWMFIGLPPSLSTANFSTCVFCSSFVEGAYYIIGGGAALVRTMVDRLRELGGECVTRTPVKRIVVENGRAVGVETGSGEFVGAKVVVSNANPYHTFFDLIPGDEVSKIFRYRLKQMEPSISLYSLYLGLDCPASRLGIPEGNFLFNYKADCEDAYERAMAGNLDKTDWCLTNYENIDKSMYPEGTGIMSFAEVAPAGDWLDLDDETYRKRKSQTQERLIAKYQKRFPQISDHIVVSEFATPRTMARYTSNYKGAVYGLSQTVEQSNSKRLRNRSPIESLFITGAWTWSGGGYEGSIMTGVQTAAAVLSEIEAPNAAPKMKWRERDNQEEPAPPKAAVENGRGEQVPKALTDLDPDDPHFRFHLEVDVFGDDLNSRGHADASSLLRYMDRGRVEAIEEICKKAGKESWLTRYTVNVYRIDSECATIVGLGHRLEVRTGLRRTSTHRAAFDQRIINLANNTVVADAMVEVLFLDEDRKLVPVPDEIAGSNLSDLKTGVARTEVVPFSDEAHFPFRALFRVYYEDTDCQGITYHVSYARFCERSLFELVRTVWPEMGTSAWMSRNKTGVARMELRYLNASTLGDYLEVRTGVLNVTAHRIILGQRITNTKDNKVIADITTEVEFRDEKERIVPIPQQVLDATLGALPNGRPPK